MSERGNVVARDSLLILFSSAIFALHPIEHASPSSDAESKPSVTERDPCRAAPSEWIETNCARGRLDARLDTSTETADGRGEGDAAKLFCGNGFGLVGQAGFEPATT